MLNRQILGLNNRNDGLIKVSRTYPFWPFHGSKLDWEEDAEGITAASEIRSSEPEGHKVKFNNESTYRESLMYNIRNFLLDVA